MVHPSRLLALPLLLLCASAHAQPKPVPCPVVEGTRLVQGPGWSFLSQAPKEWLSGCEVIAGANLVLWPKTEKKPIENFMYVSVSPKEDKTLEAFAARSAKRFREGAPKTVIMALKNPPKTRGKSQVVHVLNPERGRHEYVAYVEAPTNYYTLVLSTASPALLEKYRPQYEAYVKSFAPIAKTLQGAPGGKTFQEPAAPPKPAR